MESRYSHYLLRLSIIRTKDISLRSILTIIVPQIFLKTNTFPQSKGMALHHSPLPRAGHVILS